MRSTYSVIFFDLITLNLVSANVLKASNPNCNGNRCDKVALKAICIKNVKFKIIKIRTCMFCCEYIGYYYYSQKLNWAAQNLQLGHMQLVGHGLDITGVNRQGCQVHIWATIDNMLVKIMPNKLNFTVYEWANWVSIVKRQWLQNRLLFFVFETLFNSHV